MKRKTLAILTAAAMAAGSLSAGVCVYAADDATHIYVLTAPEDHGWTGSVATFAKEKVEEVNNDGKYTAELITSANAAEQIVNIEDIVASGEDNIAVVIQPIDDTVQSAIQQLVDAEIPYVAFDCSPISDTTIMASAGAQCEHVNHVSTQLPYAMVAAAVSFLTYIIAGFVQTAWIALPAGIILMAITLVIIRLKFDDLKM